MYQISEVFGASAPGTIKSRAYKIDVYDLNLS